MKIYYTVEYGEETLSDGDYGFWAVYDRSGYICAMFYDDGMPDAKREAEDLCARLNSAANAVDLDKALETFGKEQA